MLDWSGEVTAHPHDTPTTSSVFDTLPTELIQKILLYALHWAEISQSLLVCRGLDFPCTGLLVSRRWNAITRETPSLWTSITGLASWHPARLWEKELGQKMKRYRRYAGGLPLQLDLVVRDDRSNIFAAMVDKQPTTFSSLQRICILSDQGWGQTFYVMNLRLLHPPNPLGTPVLSICGLVELELVNTSAEHSYEETGPLLLALSSCPHLRRLSIKGRQLWPFDEEPFPTDSFGFDSVHLKHLTEVRLDGVNHVLLQLLLELDMSALETLGVECSGRLAHETVSASLDAYALGAGRFDSPRLPSLCHLILYHVQLDSHVKIFLSHSPNLRHLAVASNEFYYGLHYLTGVGDHAGLCPALESLTVLTAWPVVEDVKDVVQSRLPRLKWVILEDVTEEDAEADGYIETVRWIEDRVKVIYLPREDLQLHRVFDRMLIEGSA